MMTMKRNRIRAVLALVAAAVSLSGCDAMMFGDPNGGDCHINEDYEISCEGDGPGLQTP